MSELSGNGIDLCLVGWLLVLLLLLFLLLPLSPGGSPDLQAVRLHDPTMGDEVDG